MNEFVPSCVKYKSTKLVSFEVTLLTSIDANKASVLLTFVDNINDVVAVDTVVLIPLRLMNPIDWVPIPVKLVL